jgi:hypothetical protein
MLTFFTAVVSRWFSGASVLLACRPDGCCPCEQDCRNVELIWDQMYRATTNYGRKGLPIQVPLLCCRAYACCKCIYIVRALQSLFMILHLRSFQPSTDHLHCLCRRSVQLTSRCGTAWASSTASPCTTSWEAKPRYATPGPIVQFEVSVSLSYSPLIQRLVGWTRQERLPVYATTARPDLAKALGFVGAKIPLPYGPGETLSCPPFCMDDFACVARVVIDLLANNVQETVTRACEKTSSESKR